MKAPIKQLTPLGMLKQPQVFGAWCIWSCSRLRVSNLAGTRDIEGRAVPTTRAIPAIPRPTRKLGFDQSYRSINGTSHIRGSRAKCAHEFAVELRRASGSSLDFLQKFSQIHCFCRRLEASVQIVPQPA